MLDDTPIAELLDPKGLRQSRGDSFQLVRLLNKAANLRLAYMGAQQDGESRQGDQGTAIRHALALRDLAALIGMTFVAGFPTR